jgi:hypothetical protein
MVVLGKPRIAAILDYYSALPVEEQPAYLNRIRRTLQVAPNATDQQMVDAMAEFVNAE